MNLCFYATLANCWNYTNRCYSVSTLFVTFSEKSIKVWAINQPGVGCSFEKVLRTRIILSTWLSSWRLSTLQWRNAVESTWTLVTLGAGPNSGWSYIEPFVARPTLDTYKTVTITDRNIILIKLLNPRTTKI